MQSAVCFTAVCLLASTHGFLLDSAVTTHSLIEQQLVQPQPTRPSNSKIHHRDLVYSQSRQVCSDELYLSLLGSDPDISTCDVIAIQWDRDGILTATGIRTSKLVENSGQLWPVINHFYTGNYTPVGVCNSFVRCDGSDLYDSGQFAFDCSNVYCGPNAKRQCSGEYETVPCPPDIDEASLKDIPLLRDASCQRFRDILDATAIGTFCGQCSPDPNEDVTWIDCDPRCGICDGEGVCTEFTEHVAFTEVAQQITLCTSYKDNVFCKADVGPELVVSESYANIQRYGCQASLNDSPCTCNICGTKEDAAFASTGNLGVYSYSDLLYEVDCTAVDGVSQYNQCENTRFGELFDAPGTPTPCPGAASPPTSPVAAPVAPPVASPVDGGPMDDNLSGPEADRGIPSSSNAPKPSFGLVLLAGPPSLMMVAAYIILVF